jgi:hypothetical protein
MRLPPGRASCYDCGAHVPTSDAIQVADAMDGLVEQGITAVTDTLGLVHCEGTDDQFLTDGRVVICAECFAGCVPARLLLRHP